MKQKEKEKLIIRIKVIMDDLKQRINPHFLNKDYQEWLERNLLDKDIKFRSWVITNITKDIIDEIEKFVGGVE